MLLVIYRKTDALPLVKVGSASTAVVSQVNQLARVLQVEPNKSSCARQDQAFVTYLTNDKFIYILHDDAPQQRLLQTIEENFAMANSMKVNAVMGEYQLQGNERNLSELIAKEKSMAELKLLDKETEEVKQNVSDNLNSIIKRGANLNKMEDDSIALLDGTKQILVDAKELDLAAFWRRYAVWIVVGGVAFIWLLFKIL